MLTEEEKKIAEYGVQSGKSPQDVARAVAKYRQAQTSTATVEEKPLSNKVADAVGMGGATNVFGRMANTLIAKYPDSPLSKLVGKTGAQEEVEKLTGVPLEQSLETFTEKPTGKEMLGAGMQTAAIPIGAVLTGGASVAGKVAAGAGAGSLYDIGQDLIEGKSTAQTLTPGLATLTGAAAPLAAPILGAIKKPISKVISNLPEVSTARAGQLLTKYRAQLSNVDPQYETVLKSQPDAKKTMAYFDQAEKSAIDASQPMATKLASDRAVDAYKQMDTTLSEVGKKKSELLDSIEEYKIGGNIPGKAIDSVKNTVGGRFGIQIDNQGNISQMKGRVASVDEKSQKLITEYVTTLRGLGQSPTARQLDDFVDAMQRKLYKQSSPNLLDVADEPVIAFLKQQTGEINSQLKSNVDNLLKTTGKQATYSDLNTKYSTLIDINESLSKRLGTDGDKGAALMKALFSPQTGEPTRKLFQQIKDETGIDLFEEATLAKFAMQSVGDPRSKNLLQQIDALTGDVSKLNLVEPGSWLNFIREKADLDGRQLAEALIQEGRATAAPTK